MNIETGEDWRDSLQSMLDDGSLEYILYQVYAAHEAVDMLKKINTDLSTSDLDETSRSIEKIWNDAPDKPFIHNWPRWHDLCDLCSEVWVLFMVDEEEEDESWGDGEEIVEGEE